MAVLLSIKLAALAFAGYESVRARFFAGIGALVSLVYLTLARLASALPPYPALPLRDALQETWWLFPVAAFLLSLGPMTFAFRAARDLREDDPRHRVLERAGFAFLANVPLDVGVLVIVAVGLLLAARA